MHQSPVHSCQRSSLSPLDWEFYPYTKKQSPLAQVTFFGVITLMAIYAPSEAVGGPHNFVCVINNTQFHWSS